MLRGAFWAEGAAWAAPPGPEETTVPSVAVLQASGGEWALGAAAGSRGQARGGAAACEEFLPGACAVGGFGD